MWNQKPVIASPFFRWTVFLVLLGAVSTWSIRSTLVHAKRMNPADGGGVFKASAGRSSKCCGAAGKGFRRAPHRYSAAT